MRGKIIPETEMQDGEYYFGWQAGERAPRICRWDGSGPCFVTWERSIGGGKHLIDLTYYEFQPYEVVTWGVDEIPLED